MPSQSLTWVDGKATERLPLPDRGLDFGDGLFETLLLRRGKPAYAEQHWERLSHGLAALALPDCVAVVRDQLQAVSEAVEAKDWTWASLRVTVTRGSAPRGYRPPRVSQPRIIMSASELGRDATQLCSPATLCSSSVRMAPQSRLAGVKHLNRLEQVLAAGDAARAEVDEAIMLDQRDHLVAVSSGNLFLRLGGSLLTPPLHECGIVGTRRELVLNRWGPALGLVVTEAEIGIDELFDADEVFYSNALVGLRPVERFEQRNWTDHSTCEALFKRYLDELC
ncbi:MAG: aminodeoxychorismate lyase [Pseudomonadota bacterium]